MSNANTHSRPSFPYWSRRRGRCRRSRRGGSGVLNRRAYADPAIVWVFGFRRSPDVITLVINSAVTHCRLIDGDGKQKGGWRQEVGFMLTV